MLDTRSYAFFCEEGYEVLADLADWRSMSQRELADVARRYATRLESYTEPDKRASQFQPSSDHAARFTAAVQYHTPKALSEVRP